MCKPEAAKFRNNVSIYYKESTYDRKYLQKIGCNLQNGGGSDA
jgi:hypothetical protein